MEYVDISEDEGDDLVCTQVSLSSSAAINSFDNDCRIVFQRNHTDYRPSDFISNDQLTSDSMKIEKDSDNLRKSAVVNSAGNVLSRENFSRGSPSKIILDTDSSPSYVKDALGRETVVVSGSTSESTLSCNSIEALLGDGLNSTVSTGDEIGLNNHTSASNEQSQAISEETSVTTSGSSTSLSNLLDIIEVNNLLDFIEAIDATKVDTTFTSIDESSKSDTILRESIKTAAGCDKLIESGTAYGGSAKLGARCVDSRDSRTDSISLHPLARSPPRSACRIGATKNWFTLKGDTPDDLDTSPNLEQFVVDSGSSAIKQGSTGHCSWSNSQFDHTYSNVSVSSSDISHGSVQSANVMVHTNVMVQPLRPSDKNVKITLQPSVNACRLSTSTAVVSPIKCALGDEWSAAYVRSVEINRQRLITQRLTGRAENDHRTESDESASSFGHDNLVSVVRKVTTGTTEQLLRICAMEREEAADLDSDDEVMMDSSLSLLKPSGGVVEMNAGSALITVEDTAIHPDSVKVAAACGERTADSIAVVANHSVADRDAVAVDLETSIDCSENVVSSVVAEWKGNMTVNSGHSTLIDYAGSAIDLDPSVGRCEAVAESEAKRADSVASTGAMDLNLPVVKDDRPVSMDLSSLVDFVNNNITNTVELNRTVAADRSRMRVDVGHVKELAMDANQMSLDINSTVPGSDSNPVVMMDVDDSDAEVLLRPTERIPSVAREAVEIAGASHRRRLSMSSRLKRKSEEEAEEASNSTACPQMSYDDFENLPECKIVLTSTAADFGLSSFTRRISMAELLEEKRLADIAAEESNNLRERIAALQATSTLNNKNDLTEEQRQELSRVEAVRILNDVHPGESLFIETLFQSIFSFPSTLTLAACGFTPGSSRIDQKLTTLESDALLRIINPDFILPRFNKMSSHEAFLTWAYLLLSICDDCSVCFNLHRILANVLDRRLDNWTPSVIDLLRILLNYGTMVEVLLPDSLSSVFSTRTLNNVYRISSCDDICVDKGSNGNLKSCGTPRGVQATLNGSHFSPSDRNSAKHKENNELGAKCKRNGSTTKHCESFSTEPLDESRYTVKVDNLKLVLDILTKAISVRSVCYNADDRVSLVIILLRISLDSQVRPGALWYAIRSCLEAVLKTIPQRESDDMIRQLCELVPLVTGDHHNAVYIIGLLQAAIQHCGSQTGSHYFCSSSFIRRLCVEYLCRLLPEANVSLANIDDFDNCRVRVACEFIASLDLSANSDFSLARSVLCLVEHLVGFIAPPVQQKNNLKALRSYLEHKISHVRDHMHHLDRSQWKDLAVMLKLRWTAMLKSMGTQDIFEPTVSKPMAAFTTQIDVGNIVLHR